MKKMICIFLTGIALGATAQVKMPPIFADNMILQQQTQASIWGKAAPGKTVTVKTSWDKKSYTATVAQDSLWRVKVATPEASTTPYEITVACGKAQTLKNILIGEVWFCGGQSNMEQPMKGFPRQPTRNSLEDIVQSSNNQLRCFTIKKTSMTTPLFDTPARWDIASPNTTGEFTATGYYFARLVQQVLNIPVGIIHCSWGGSSIQAWMSDDAIAAFPELKVPQTKEEIKTPNQDPTVLFKGMLNSVLGYSIKGSIWYQGETNRKAPDRYIEFFSTMHQDWIKKWDCGTFPIYFCQIAPFHYENSNEAGSAFFREAQLKIAQTQPNTGMAVLLDAGEENCIHPSNKKAAGERLAYIALNKNYGFDNLSFTAPVFKSVVVKDSVMQVHFDQLGTGLTSNDQFITNLEIAGADKKFYPVKAKVNLYRHFLELSTPEVPNPVAVRYGFKNFTQGNLYGVNGLPVSSFRSDDWNDVQ